MNNRKENTDKTKLYNRLIRRKKILLYGILVPAYLIILIWAINILDDSVENKLDPQISRAIIQVSRFLPQLESNEQGLRDAYRRLGDNREKFSKEEGINLSRRYESSELKLNSIVNETISWIDRVTKMKVGRDGYAIVVSKETKTILGHPDARYLGERLVITPIINNDALEDVTTYMKEINTGTTVDDLDIDYAIFRPDSFLIKDVSRAINASIYGSVLEYKDYYIICGIPIAEVLHDTIKPAFIISLISLLCTWLLVKYTGYVLKDHTENKRAVLIKLVSYSVIILFFVFLLSWYYLVLTDVTNDLKTMDRHANAAVDTLEAYKKQKDKINAWLDEQYLLQCRLAADVIKSIGKDNLTRDEVRKLAVKLGVKHIYIFDENGKVRATNAPFDHFVLSKDPADQSYAFRVLLDGADHVIQEPMNNEVLGEPMQYVAVGLRDDDDLCDGFVQIGVNPMLRESITSQLEIGNVLNNLIIGLPDHALAVDKDTFEIVSTTGIGFVGESIEELGFTEDELKKNFNGFLRIRESGNHKVSVFLPAYVDICIHT